MADFVGEGAIICGEVIDQQHVSTALGVVEGVVPESCEPGCPADVQLHSTYEGNGQTAEVVAGIFRGAHFFYTLMLQDESQIFVLAPSHQKYQVGDTVGFSLDVKHLVILKGREAQSS